MLPPLESVVELHPNLLERKQLAVYTDDAYKQKQLLYSNGNNVLQKVLLHVQSKLPLVSFNFVNELEDGCILFTADDGPTNVTDWLGYKPPIYTRKYASRINIGIHGWSQKSHLHELLHSLGFSHVHQQANRNKFIVVNWGNIPHGKSSQYQVYKMRIRRPNGHQQIAPDTEYNHDSVLHYTGSEGIGGRRTWNFKDDLAKLPVYCNPLRNTLTDYDIFRFIAYYYETNSSIHGTTIRNSENPPDQKPKRWKYGYNTQHPTTQGISHLVHSRKMNPNGVGGVNGNHQSNHSCRRICNSNVECDYDANTMPLVPIASGPEQHDPNCSKNDCCGAQCKNTYLDMMKERWNVLRIDTCKPHTVETFNPCEGDLGSKSTAVGTRIVAPDVCELPQLSRQESQYKKDYPFPKSHNTIDDCCPAPCPCPDKFPELTTNISYLCTSPQESCAPLDDLTTSKYFYHPHDVKPRYRHPLGKYDPCECPFEECTITKSDYTKKNPIPTGGPPCAQIIEHGLWSTDQFCKDFTDCTSYTEDYPEKYSHKRMPFKPTHNLHVPHNASTRCQESITQSDFQPQTGAFPASYPEWTRPKYVEPEIEMERCTTYKHFYRPYPFTQPLQSDKVGTPNAIPFCTLNKLCYSCHDPKPNQKIPVEMRDNDPWPYVKRSPIHYQNNLHVDPCADFCDLTMYKTNYYPKSLCRPTESFKPIRGYIEPTIPFNDDTTNRISHRAYNKCEYDAAVGHPENTYKDTSDLLSHENSEDCQPRFSPFAPCGPPIKPFLDPCVHNDYDGPFDDRSTYNQDFRFRSPDVVEEMVADRCQVSNVKKGVLLSRFDYVDQAGKKAAIMPPPISKGYRCIHPCNTQSTDTLYRIDNHDFWKTMNRSNLELYRGHPTIRTRRQSSDNEPAVDENEDGGDILVFQPICMSKKHGQECLTVEEVRQKTEQMREKCKKAPTRASINFQTPEHQRCRKIPYSGQDILHRPPPNVSHVSGGYK